VTIVHEKHIHTIFEQVSKKNKRNEHNLDTQSWHFFLQKMYDNKNVHTTASGLSFLIARGHQHLIHFANASSSISTDRCTVPRGGFKIDLILR